ncbi:MAG: LptF/LptG family permease [Candidatus Scalindua sp.]|nr:LptF/LptG family permease [Candidatus Scalindua sp.]
MLKTLQKYLIKELFRTFLPAFVCFELLMLLGFSIQLLHKGLDAPSLVHIIPYLSVYALPHALPSSLLTATVMTYGRLSADNEITAIKIAGVHLYKIVVPIIVTGILFSLITLYLNAELLPKSYFEVRKFQEKAVKQVLAKHFITAKKKINVYPYQVYISNIEHGIYKNIAVFEYAEEFIVNIILAEEGEIDINAEKDLAVLTLRRGEFIKPSGEGDASAPKMGSFEEATFDIPFKQRIRNTSLQYATLTNIISQKGEVDGQLKDAKEFFKDIEKTLDETTEQISLVNNKKKDAERIYETAKAEIEIASKNISKQEKIIKRTNIDIENFGKYMQIAQNNLHKILETGGSSNVKAHETIKKNDLEQIGKEDAQKRVSLIKKTINREKMRIKNAKRKLKIAKRLIKSETDRIEIAKKSIEESRPVLEKLEMEYVILDERIESANKQKLSRELSLNIHKRLSPSFSCIAFILIGIPIGIMSKSNNLLVSLGISFVLILFFYYPLVALGLILTEESMYPIIPSLWGANIFNLIVSGVLFRRILNT